MLALVISPPLLIKVIYVFTPGGYWLSVVIRLTLLHRHLLADREGVVRNGGLRDALHVVRD